MRSGFARLLAAVVVLAGWAGLAGAQEVFVDDFSKDSKARWIVVAGEWNWEEGALVHVHDDKANHDMIVADFPFEEGLIEARCVALKENEYKFGSVGLVVKHLDKERVIYFRYGSYGSKNVDGPSFQKVVLGSGKPELGREYRLSAVRKGGLIGVCIDDVMIGVARDPWPGQPGRAGLFTESGARFDDFKVTRWK